MFGVEVGQPEATLAVVFRTPEVEQSFSYFVKTAFDCEENVKKVLTFFKISFDLATLLRLQDEKTPLFKIV